MRDINPTIAHQEYSPIVCSLKKPVAKQHFFFTLTGVGKVRTPPILFGRIARFLILFLGVVCFYGQGTAQQSAKMNQEKKEVKDEFSIEVGGGLSGFAWTRHPGEVHQEVSGLVGVGYTHYFNSRWALSTGIGYQSHRAEIAMKKISGAYQTKDIEGEDFEFQYTGGSYRQYQQSKFYNIPLTVQYLSPGEETHWYVRTGAQVGIPNRSNYQSFAQTLQTAGYYEQYKTLLHDPLFMGFGDFSSAESSKEKMELKTAISAIIEAGVKQDLGKKSSIYFGIFLNYGLNGIEKKENRSSPWVNYQADDPTAFFFPLITETSTAKRLRPLAAGIKCRIAVF